MKALPYAIGFILFNVILSIMILAFSQDPLINNDVGKPGFVAQTLSANSSELDDSGLSLVKADSWVTNYVTTLFGLPWWIQIFLYTIELALIILIGWALIRGL